jgi:hypothetical protein
VLTFIPSATEFQYLSYEFPEGCAETPGFKGDSVQQPYNLIASLNAVENTDVITVDLNFWGQYVPHG